MFRYQLLVSLLTLRGYTVDIYCSSGEKSASTDLPFTLSVVFRYFGWHVFW